MDLSCLDHHNPPPMEKRKWGGLDSGLADLPTRHIWRTGDCPWPPQETNHRRTKCHIMGGGGDALAGKRPQRRPRKRAGRRLQAVAKAVGGGYCRLHMPLRLALGVRGTVAGRRLGALRGGGGFPPAFQCIPLRGGGGRANLLLPPQPLGVGATGGVTLSASGGAGRLGCGAVLSSPRRRCGARDPKSACWIHCYLSAVLGVNNTGGMPLDELEEAWQRPFRSEDPSQGGCPAMPINGLDPVPSGGIPIRQRDPGPLLH